MGAPTMRLLPLACFFASLVCSVHASLNLEQTLATGIPEYTFDQVITHLVNYIVSDELKPLVWEMRKDPNAAPVVANMLINSNAFLEPYLYGILKESVQIMFNQDDLAAMTPEQLADRKDQIVALWSSFLHRTDDMSIVQLPLIHGKLVQLDDIIPDGVASDLYTAGGAYHYLPVGPRPKLFEQVHHLSVASMMATGETGNIEMFSVPIIMDYIIPMFRQKFDLAPREKQILSSIPGLDLMLSKLAIKLLWISYILEGGLFSTQSYKLFEAGFKKAGLDWNSITFGIADLQDFSAAFPHRLQDTFPIYMVAKFFGFDLTAIANRLMNFDPLSQRIAGGDIPYHLSRDYTPNILDLHKAVYEKDPVQMFLFEGKLKTFAEIQSPSINAPQVIDLTETEKFQMRNEEVTTMPRIRVSPTPSIPLVDYDMLPEPQSVKLPSFDDLFKPRQLTAIETVTTSNYVWPPSPTDS